MMSPGALVPVTEYVTCRGPAGVVVGGDGATAADVVGAGGGAAVVADGDAGGGGGGGGGGVTVTVWVSVAVGVSVVGGGGGGLVVVISSCTGGVDAAVVVPGLASLLVSVRVTSRDTDTTSAIAATMAVTPTTHGQRGAPRSSSGSGESS